ncbi:MAG: ATP-binding cassette domain-containing protein [Candidatus Zixiibacteriota bacterium]
MGYKPLINIKNLTLSYLNKTFFENLSLSVGQGEIVAVIGANGCGKTTLLDFILAAYTNEIDARREKNLIIKGELFLAPKTRLAYLPQNLRGEIAGEGLYKANMTSAIYKRLLEEFSLARLNYQERYREGKPIEDRDGEFLSEGERQKEAIAMVFGLLADVLLFDEPTNYLDIEGITVFEHELEQAAARGCGMLLVSHDRSLINNVADKTVYLTPNGAYQTEGGFSAVWSLAGSDFEARQKEARVIRNKITRLQTEMRTRMNWAAQKEKSKIGAGSEKPHIAKMAAKMASRAKAARNKADKEIKRLENTKPFIPKEVRLNFPKYRVRHREVFALQNIFFDYSLIGTDGERLKDFPMLLEHIDLAASTRDKLCLMGTNGAGKSTLLKIILGEIRAQKGERCFNENVPIKYLPQGLARFFTEPRLIDNFRDTGCDETGVRSYLGSVLLRGDKVTEPVDRFSQGELMRAGIVKCILQQAEFLVLDEPTSHLDIESVQVLERVLGAFPGGYLIISHDRTFVENVAERLYLLENGRIMMV